MNRILNSRRGVKMNIGLNEIWDGKIPADETDLAELSDKIWEMGELDTIQEMVSPDLFQLHIAINMIGNWQCDGWDGIIAYQPHLVPYISEVLAKFGMPQMQHTFDEVIAIFPDFITFEDDALYCDMINFLHNMRLKVSDERLNRYTKEERQAMEKQYKEKLNQLEAMTAPYGDMVAPWMVGP